MTMLVQPRPKPQMQEVLREPPPPPQMITGGRSPRDVERDRLMAAELAKSAGDMSPVMHWTQGLGRVADGVASALANYRAREDEEKGRAGFKSKMDAYMQAMKDGSIPKETIMAQELAMLDDPWASEGARGFVNARMASRNQPPTDDQREYEAAKQGGYGGTFMDYMTTLRQAGAGVPTATQRDFEYGKENPDFAAYQKTVNPPRPLPSGVQNAEDEDIQAIGGVSSMNSTLDQTINKIDAGKLKLGFFTNLGSEGLNYMGQSNDNSVEYSIFMQDMKGLQNGILLLHKGVQTEGDAKRALQQIITHPTDEKVVKANLLELKRLNARAAQLRRVMLDVRRQRNNLPAFDPSVLGEAGASLERPGGDVTPPGGGQSGAPQPGTIEDGMRFKGGNPADPNSWEPVANGQGGPQFTAPDADPYGLQDLTRQREEMLRRHRGAVQ